MVQVRQSSASGKKVASEGANATITTIARVAASLGVQVRDLFAPLRRRSR